jgi:hypothetical protein
MERLAELINKLKEQFEQKADTNKLLGITMLIERELTKPQSAKISTTTSSKISVVMPASRNGYHQEQEAEDQSPVFTAGKENQPLPEAPREILQFEKPEQPKEEPVAKAQPVVNEPKRPVQAAPPEKKPNIQEFAFNPLIEIPTLAQQQSIQEINEMIGIRDASLNDKLKDNKVEIGEILKDHPIRDLKKAIGVNDRYVFINELFRGDEVMYERSLKTINGFRIFAEAEYWIERELKVKLGWEEHKETTRHFYQLVRRRFS